MPELPEVESLRRSLQAYVLDQKILKVEVRLPKLVSGRGTKRLDDVSKAVHFQKFLQGKTILSLERRAKNLIFGLSDGGVLLVHLKMTGQLVFVPKTTRNQVATKTGDIKPVIGGHPIMESEKSLPHKHTYVIFELSEGNLYYNDTRQFGYLLPFVSLDEVISAGHFSGLGLEPLSSEFTESEFTRRLGLKKGNLKKVFLDQSVVVGLGNIYCDEVCFQAGVRPTRMVQTLSPEEVSALYQAIISVIPKAVELGGSSVANYLLADGSRGNYAREHKVYKRGGKPCLVCNQTLEQTRLAGRTTVFCPHDQH